MTTISCIGLLAGILTSGAAVPQVIQTYRTRQARDLSIWQLIMLLMGMLLWLIYGISLADLPLICANTFSIVCYAALIVMKLRFSGVGEGAVSQ